MGWFTEWFWWLKDVAVATPLPAPPPARSSLGMAALEAARSQVGRGESDANNAGPDVDRYRRDLDGRSGPGGPWCAAFVSWCLESAMEFAGVQTAFKAFTTGTPQVVTLPGRSHSAKALFRNCLRVGARVEAPAPGDIVLWHRGAAGARTGHIGIVSRPREGSLFYSIEGNRGGFPSKVREYPHEVGEALLLGFCRLL